LVLPFLSGCDFGSVTDVWNWIVSFLSQVFGDLLCWLLKFFYGGLQFFVDGFSNLVVTLLSVLPEYTPPMYTLSDIQFVRYAAYFLPIVEIAWLIKYFLVFYTGFFVIRIFLRWLKVVR